LRLYRIENSVHMRSATVCAMLTPLLRLCIVKILSVHPGQANGNKGGNGQHKGWTAQPTTAPKARGKSAEAKARAAAKHTPKPTTNYPKR
jgi:hypothetical protein